jgi:hypothetical protein
MSPGADSMLIDNLYMHPGGVLADLNLEGSLWLGCNVWLEDAPTLQSVWHLVRVAGGLVLRRRSPDGMAGEKLVSKLIPSSWHPALVERWNIEHPHALQVERWAAGTSHLDVTREVPTSDVAKKNTGLRFNSGKLAFSLIPPEVRIELARIYTVGAIKYTPDNWLGGMNWSVMIDCAERHWEKWKAGLTVDGDTGGHHLALAAWNILGLMIYQLRGLGTDDRTPIPIDENFQYTSGPAAELGLGLTPEELKELEARYRDLREAALRGAGDTP